MDVTITITRETARYWLDRCNESLELTLTTMHLLHSKRKLEQTVESIKHMKEIKAALEGVIGCSDSA